MAFKIALVICCALEFLFVPMFLKAQWPNATKKSLLLKMICASLFVAVGVLSMYVSNNFSTYAFTIVLGLVFGWIGDFFLHVSSSAISFGIGFTSFLIGHIVYIVGYINAVKVLSQGHKAFNIVELSILVALLIVIILLGKIVMKVNMGSTFNKISMYSYLGVLLTMLIKATSLGISYIQTGVSDGIWALAVLFFGALCFMLSDVSLGIIMFGGQRKNYPLKKFNLITYFVAQVLLGLSVLFINA